MTASAPRDVFCSSGVRKPTPSSNRKILNRQTPDESAGLLWQIPSTPRWDRNWFTITSQLLRCFCNLSSRAEFRAHGRPELDRRLEEIAHTHSVQRPFGGRAPVLRIAPGSSDRKSTSLK